MMNVSPWPAEGKSFRFERFVAYKVVANFGDETGKVFSCWWGKWWFLTVRTKWFHFYIGHKPINLMDVHFHVPQWFDRTSPAVEWSGRFGVGDIS